MGGQKINTNTLKQQCGQGMTRMNIHRSKKLNKIAKDKDEVCKHLNAQNEVNAKIYCETLINDENQIPCYDIAGTLCDQIKGRGDYIGKFGAPQDMTQTFATIIHMAPKMGVEELMVVRKELTKLLGKEFALEADENKKIINGVVAEKIDFKRPMDGEVIYRMKELAKERNIQYTPTQDMQQALNSYLDLKGKTDPMEPIAPLQVPQYNPHAPLINPNQGAPGFNPDMPPSGGFQPPPGNFPPGGNMPMYNPAMPPPVQPQFDMGMPQHQPQFQAPPVYLPPPAENYMPPPNVAFPIYQPGPTGDMPAAHGMPVNHLAPESDKFNSDCVEICNDGGGENGMDDLEARLRALDGK